MEDETPQEDEQLLGLTGAPPPAERSFETTLKAEEKAGQVLEALVQDGGEHKSAESAEKLLGVLCVMISGEELTL